MNWCRSDEGMVSIPTTPPPLASPPADASLYLYSSSTPDGPSLSTRTSPLPEIHAKQGLGTPPPPAAAAPLLSAFEEPESALAAEASLVLLLVVLTKFSVEASMAMPATWNVPDPENDPATGQGDIIPVLLPPPVAALLLGQVHLARRRREGVVHHESPPLPPPQQHKNTANV